MATQTRLELVTSSVTGWRSNRTELPLRDLGCCVPALRRGRGGLYRHSHGNARQEITFSCMQAALAGRSGRNTRADLKSGVNDNF